MGQTGVRSFNYVPIANFSGVDSFLYTVSDGQHTSAPATMTIDVNPVNSAPEAFDLAISIDEDTSIEGGLLWAFDAETSIDSLTFALTSLSMHGTVTQTGVRSFNYAPNSNFTGVDAFQYTVSDGQATSAAATVTITVNPSGSRRMRKNLLAG